MRDAGISNSEFARRLRLHEKEARRILDPHHPTKFASDRGGVCGARAARVDGARVVFDRAITVTTNGRDPLCGNFAGIGCAQSCFVVPIATGAPRQVIEITTCLYPLPLS